jgi:formylglycine-generating enzyme required for sulfatase activity
MHGNLFEWTHGWFEDYGVEAIIDPLGAKEGSLRVYRGGCWNYGAAFCRTAYRGADDPSNRSGDCGFRLALSPSGVTPEAGSVKGAEPSGGGTEGASAEQRPELP